MTRFADADQNVTEARNQPTAVVQCRTCLYLAGLPDDEAGDLRALLKSRSSRHMVKVLHTVGFKIARSSLANHQANHQ